MVNWLFAVICTHPYVYCVYNENAVHIEIALFLGGNASIHISWMKNKCYCSINIFTNSRNTAYKYGQFVCGRCENYLLQITGSEYTTVWGVNVLKQCSSCTAWM